MKTLFLPDANVLINALRQGAQDHEKCLSWLLESTQGGCHIGICELVEVALLRICTHPRTPIVPMNEAIGFWYEDLLSYPNTIRLSANAGHNRTFISYITEIELCGNDVNDAWLAALAVEHGATLVSMDQGFERFPGLRWHNPAKVN